MEVKIFKKSPIFACASYLISHNNHCLLIDCGYFSDELKQEIDKHAFFDGVVLTHKHYDHIAGLIDLIKCYPNIKIYSHMNKDLFLSSGIINCSHFMLEEDVILDYPVFNLIEGINKIGEFTFNIIYTPGHTSDCLTLEIENCLFTGDTLFSETKGRTDLPTSSDEEMRKSLLVLKAMLLKKEYQIFPGHGVTSTSKEVLINNLYI